MTWRRWVLAGGAIVVVAIVVAAVFVLRGGGSSQAGTPSGPRVVGSPLGGGGSCADIGNPASRSSRPAGNAGAPAVRSIIAASR